MEQLAGNESKKNIKIVIGCNAGDEGKGLAVDYFASQHDHGLVVLTNGGAQRAHTVEYKNGMRHVFHHFGSATIRGWDTYLSENFILNPMEFCREYDQIKEQFDGEIIVWCNTKCMWSTPYDMIFNQILHRLNQKHDTYGMGIWATKQRYEYYRTNNIKTYTMYELYLHKDNITDNFNLIDNIRKYYLRLVYRAVNIKDRVLINDLIELLLDLRLLQRFLFDIYRMAEIIGNHFALSDSPLNIYDNIIFENGQGLLLDESIDISYGTPSSTGLKIPINMLYESQNIKNVEVCYVTRSYLTRHGFGKLSDEVNKDSINPYIFDETNITNDFQGSLRFGKLYPHDIIARIDEDWLFNVLFALPKWYWKEFKQSVMITHMNECGFPINELKEECNELNKIYISDSKFSDDIYEYVKGNKDDK